MVWNSNSDSWIRALDILLGVYMLLDQILKDNPRLDNAYSRCVGYGGNPRALELIQRVFQVESGEWRGIGRVPFSAYGFKPEFRGIDALEHYGIKPRSGIDARPGCCCHLIIIGKLYPDQCPMFLRGCYPEHPLGPCMVSMEGSCRIWTESAFDHLQGLEKSVQREA